MKSKGKKIYLFDFFILIDTMRFTKQLKK